MDENPLYQRLLRTWQLAHVALLWFLAIRSKTKSAFAVAAMATVPLALTV
jgi:hypothetical protein